MIACVPWAKQRPRLITGVQTAQRAQRSPHASSQAIGMPSQTYAFRVLKRFVTGQAGLKHPQQ